MDLGTPHLRVEITDSIARCTVDNPSQRNAMTDAMYAGLAHVVRQAEADPDVRALIVTGIDDVFIVGGDPSSHVSDASPIPDSPVEDALPFAAFRTTSLPVVAAINGHCQASGVWLAVLADVAVVSERARFRLPELRLGVNAPWSSALLPSVIGLARAKDLALTSKPFTAAEALAMGLVARVVPHEELPQAALTVAQELLEAGPHARAAWKRTVHAPLRAVDHGAVMASINTAEAKEGFAAYADHRPPRWSPRSVGTKRAKSND